MIGEGLARSRRLSRSSDIEAVVRSGRRQRTPRIDILWRPNDLGHPRLGVVVPLYGAAAVQRNRLRRRLREIGRRRILPSIGSVDLVIRSRPAAYKSTFEDLVTDLETWLHTQSP